MYNSKFIITEDEKKRILLLHKKNNTLLKEENGSTVEEYPPCVQSFGPPTLGGNIYSIDGKKEGKHYNWEGYSFFSNLRVMMPGGNMASYFCKGDQPVLGQKMGPSVGGKTTTQALGGTVLKIGSKGDAVKQVQNRLVNGAHGDGVSVGGNQNCGTDVNSCDGVYGRGTFDAVKKFQTSAGVKSDGVVGDETWQQLFGGEAPPQPKPQTVVQNNNTTSRHQSYQETNKYATHPGKA